jgi:hypothetical protein
MAMAMALALALAAAAAAEELSWLPPHARMTATMLTSSPPAPPLTSRPWLDATLSPDKRTELLLAVMTVEEKVGQLGYGGCGDPNSTVHRNPHGIGGCGVVGPPPVGPPPPPGVPATGGAYNTNELNRLLNASTRLGIPASIIAETTHSGGASGTTVFPMPCLQGATWNLSLVEEIGRINALQLRAAGGDQALSPILQVCTDPRFGRMEGTRSTPHSACHHTPRTHDTHALSLDEKPLRLVRTHGFSENFGEDPTLVAKCGVAAVTGLQGKDGLGGASEYLGSPGTRVASQAKHFAMYGAGPKDGCECAQPSTDLSLLPLRPSASEQICASCVCVCVRACSRQTLHSAAGRTHELSSRST